MMELPTKARLARTCRPKALSTGTDIGTPGVGADLSVVAP